MSEVTFRSDMTVELIDCMANDIKVVQAARVSTKGKNEPTEDAPGLIDFLMKGRHGTPFEHNAFTFYVQAPIFVWREFMRHRIGFSYNEESGRYKQLDPVFYVPTSDRNMVQVGKTGAYTFEAGTHDQYEDVRIFLQESSQDDYDAYQHLLSEGIAKEVARMLLPVNIYSSAYVTCNARSIMSFLSLRTKREGSMFPSFPQREIEMVAEQIEAVFEEKMPLTWNAFNRYGRVSP